MQKTGGSGKNGAGDGKGTVSRAQRQGLHFPLCVDISTSTPTLTPTRATKYADLEAGPGGSPSCGLCFPQVV